jgi:hypothetical protein
MMQTRCFNDADIDRIEFVNNNSVHPNKEELYFNAINHVARQYENHPAANRHGIF